MNFIAFPALGIKWMINPVAFTVGPFSVRWYGIMLSLAIFATLALALRQSARHGITGDSFVDMFMYALPVSVIFSRLFFVAVEWDSFRDNLWGIFKIWEGGITIYGAVIGAVLTVVVFCRVRKYDLWQWVDFACVYLPLAQAIGRYGNFFNQELYGGNTTLPWGMTGNIIQAYPNPGVDGSLPVHPTFLYESLWNLLVFAILMLFRPRSKKRGQVFAAYLFLYSIGRFGMEFVRTDVFSFENSTLRANMLAAAVIAVIGIVLFILRGRTADAEWVPVPAGAPAVKAASADTAETVPVSDMTGTEQEGDNIVGKSAYGDILRSLKEKEAQEHMSSPDQVAAAEEPASESPVSEEPLSEAPISEEPAAKEHDGNEA
jgi:phosphatidylglycerol---prolipoprotein diacylglyceryl transferase